MDQHTTTPAGLGVPFFTAAVGIGSGCGRGSSSPSGSSRSASSSAGWDTTVWYLSNDVRREPEGKHGTDYSTRT